MSAGPVTIGEAARRSGLPRKTIRYYEDAGIISSAARTDNGYRRYDEDDIYTLRFIRHARALGFTLKEVGDLLALYRDKTRKSGDVKRVALAHVADINRKIADLTAIRDTIDDLAGRCHGDDRPDCPILDSLKDRALDDR